MRVLVLGGTGAMGSHVCSKLAERGWEVVSTTRRERKPDGGIAYAVGNAHDPAFLDGLLAKHWDAVVDFMVWSTDEFRERYGKLLAGADQYLFTSSYRVYADSPVVNEESPRLLDAIDDPEYLATDEYALSKARCEDMLFRSGKGNWTVVRPAVTYDGAVGRLQLAVLESDDWLWRAVNGVPVPLPGEMLGKQATMSWGGDVAEMIARLVGNPGAQGEAFTVSGSDHMTWADVVEAYRRVLPSLEVVPCGLTEFERVRGGVYQIRYDRMFDRVIDNSKVLAATGMDSAELRNMDEALPAELSLFLSGGNRLRCAPGFQGKFDQLAGSMPAFLPVAKDAGPVGLAKYLVRRYLK